MAIWRSSPPSDDTLQPLTLFRIPATKTVTGTLLTADALSVPTHYYLGRTTPCTEEGCEACEKKMRARWYIYFGVWNPKKRTTAILELPARSFDPIETYQRAYGTLRGANVQAFRQPARPNGQVVVTIQAGSIPPNELPEAPNIAQHLCRIWGLNWEEEASEAMKHNAAAVATAIQNRRNGQQPTPAKPR